MSKTIRIRQLLPSEAHLIEELYHDSFFPNEPVSMRLKLTGDCAKPYVERVAQLAARDGLSFVAEDESTNEVVGMAVFLIHSKSQPIDLEFPDTEENRKMNIFIRSTDAIYEGVDMFLLHSTDSFVLFEGLAVKEGYRRRGIAEKIARAALNRCLETGNDVVYSIATGGHTQALFTKLGFPELKRIVYYLDGVIDGDEMKPHKYLVLYGRKLESKYNVDY